MTATSMSRTVLPVLAFLIACGLAIAFAIQHVRREPAAASRSAADVPVVSKPASDTPDQAAAALAKAQVNANALAAVIAGSTLPPDSNNGVPTFDVVRIDPTGEAVIAGRAVPGATIELLRNGEFHDRAVADQTGQFVMVAPRLPSGTYDLTLRAKQPDGKLITSKQSVAVVLEPNPSERPVVALMTPDKPTVVLSQPSAPVAGTVVVQAVEIEPGGKLHVSGQARPGAAVRLYLNDSFVASVSAGPDGRFAVTINEGVAPGDYRVRLDELGPNSSTVRARAEVPFNVPSMSTGLQQAPANASKTPNIAGGQQPQIAAAGGTAPRNEGASSTVVVPKIVTTTVSRGDSLWRLSRDTYGAGTRFAVIYKANREQIRNPNLIYPGQTFVLPLR